MVTKPATTDRATPKSDSRGSPVNSLNSQYVFS
jgi:hypothetical protein